MFRRFDEIGPKRCFPVVQPFPVPVQVQKDVRDAFLNVVVRKALKNAARGCVRKPAVFPEQRPDPDVRIGFFQRLIVCQIDPPFRFEHVLQRKRLKRRKSDAMRKKTPI